MGAQLASKRGTQMAWPSEVARLVHRYGSARKTFESDNYLEASVRQEFLDPFFRALGWDVGNEKGWADQNKEVVVEPSLDVEGQKKTPDYAFRVGPESKFFVEAKRPSLSIRTDREAALQLRTYGWNAKLPLSVLTNFGEFAIYDTTVKPKPTDRATTARIDYFTFDEFESRWADLNDLLGHDAVWRGSLEEFAQEKPTRRGSLPVDVAILAEIERWRERLASEIARRNSRLSVSELNWAVQSTIDRVMFLRICEDRDIQPYGDLRGAANSKDVFGELLRLFRRADDRFNSGLFHFSEEKGRASAPDLITPLLDIRGAVLKDLILELYPPLSPFNFRLVGVEVLGQVYEQFLGRVIRITTGRQVRVEEKPEVKKAGGVVYTPESVVSYILGRTLGPALEGKSSSVIAGRNRAKSAHPLRVLDPACGSGSFLLAAYRQLLDWYLEQYLRDPEKHAKGRDPVLRPAGQDEWRLSANERKRILLDHIYGVDIDAQAVEVTKLSLLLSCLEGETDASLNQQMQFFRERALPDLENNIRCGNSLIGSDYVKVDPNVTTNPERRAKVNLFDWASEFPDVFAAPPPGFDVVIGNPPYVLLQDEFRDDLQLEYFRERYKVASYKLDTYHLFIERSLSLTRSEGWFSMITPTNYLTNNHLDGLRRHLLDDAELCSITVIDGSVFPRRAVDCAVLVASSSSGTNSPVAMFHADSGPHKRLVISTEGALDPDRVRATPHALFTGTADAHVASALDKLEGSGTTLGDVARVHFGKQLRDRKKFVDDVITVPTTSKRLGRGYVRCYTGSDVNRWSLRWSGLALLNEEVARKGGCWDHTIQDANHKLLTRQIGRFPTWAIDELGYQCLNTVFMVLPTDDRYDPWYLLGLLNSSSLRAYWLDRYYDQRQTFPKVKGTYLKQLPLPTFPDDGSSSSIAGVARELVQLVEEEGKADAGPEKLRIKRAVLAKELELDDLVAHQYGLTISEAEALTGAARL